MDLTVLEKLRNELKNILPNDLESIDDHICYVELLNKFRFALAKSDELKGDNYPALLESLLSVGEDSVYSSTLRFIFELIQNVDDCEYNDPSNATLDIKFDTNQGQIVLTYNEKGFSPFNVFAITGIAEAAKNISAEKIEIGEKGIGFKSVFGVANKVLIQSSYFSFELHKNNFTIPIPSYDDFEPVAGTRLTLFVAPELSYRIYRSFVNEYCKRDALFNKNPLLFLNKLTELRLYIDGFRSLKFSVSRNTSLFSRTQLSTEEDVQIAVDLRDHCNGLDTNIRQDVRCIRYTMPITYNRKMCQSRYGETTAFTEKKMFMQVVVPSVDALYGDDAIKNGTLYSFLPTQIKLTVPLACHVPFKLAGSREHVDPQGNNLWFTHSCNCFAQMMKDVFLDLAHRCKEDVVNYVPFKNSYLFEASSEKVNCLKQAQFKGETFLQLPIFYTVENNFRCSQEIFCFPISQENIPDPEGAYLLLGEKRELFLPSKQSYRKNPGISIVHNVAVKLFERAMTVPDATENILNMLSTFEDFSFSKMAETVGSQSFTVSQIVSFSKHSKCANAFRDVALDKLKKRVRPEFSIAITSNELCDVRTIDSAEDPLDATDFDATASQYLKSINYKCLKINGVPENFYFIAKNVLILPQRESIHALSDFCGQVDKNSIFSATLRFKAASNSLNTADNALTPVKYLQMLRSVRGSIRKAFGQGVYENYIRIINESGANPDRYINELLQNADDCTYPGGEVPTFELAVSRDKQEITTRYNETGFTKDNVRSITAIGESTKKRLLASQVKSIEEIGEKGIGFKSVFSVAKRVEIFSGGFNFALSDKEPTVPEVLNGTQTIDNGTFMRFKMKSELRPDFFTEGKILQLCLCLRKLQNIRLDKFNVSIKDEDQIRKITINGKCYEYKIIVYCFSINDTAVVEEREKHQRHIGKEQKVVCYVPLNRTQKDFYLYSGLPTLLKAKIPLVIDAPFELTTSRDNIINNKWNSYVKEEVYNALIHTIENLKSENGISVLRFLRFRQEGSLHIPDLFEDSALNKSNLLSKLKPIAFLSTYNPETFATPMQPQLHRFPELVHYLLSRGENIGILPNEIIKANENQYDMVFSALGIKEESPKNVLNIVCKYYQRYMQDESFRKILYDYLLIHKMDLPVLRSILQSMRIIPVKGSVLGQIDFISWSDKIYVKDDTKVSPESCYILDTAILSKADCEQILGKDINVLNDSLEITIYRQSLFKKLRDSTLMENLYAYLMDEFTQNRRMLVACVDLLISNSDQIPLKNENGLLRQGRIYVSDQPAEYFWGDILPNHIAHKECDAFARFIQCKNIKDVHYEDLDILEPLNAGDIESFQAPDDFSYGFEILENCKRKGLISQELIDKYELGGLTRISVDYDEEMLNQPIKDITQFKKHMKQILSNPIRIVKKRVQREVPYGVKTSGVEFLLDNKDTRMEAMRRYSPEPGYCICQMCKETKDIKYIEVNNIQRTPAYYWQSCAVSLCLVCSKHFEELRQNETIHKQFLKAIKSANPMGNRPIIIPIGTEELVFGQTHIAEIQEILKQQD